MAIKSFSVTSYGLSIGYKSVVHNNIIYQGVLTCQGAGGYRFFVYGLHPSSQRPGPYYNEEIKLGAIFIPFVELHNYIDLVRNEKPVYAHMNSDQPYWNGLSTREEPVGEQEGIDSSAFLL